MKSSLRFALVFILLAGGAIAQPAVDHDKLLEWHKKMTLNLKLTKKGCFRITYPKTKWEPEKCATPQNLLYLTDLPVRTAGHANVGGGHNFAAQVTSKPISTAIGSFDSVTIKSGDTSKYSLQINTQAFDTELCDGAQDPKECKGMQQFMYAPIIVGGVIQYWLINYGSKCPGPNDGLNTSWRPIEVEGKTSCTRFSHISIPASDEPISALADLSLAGTARSGKWDILTVRKGRQIHAVIEDSILGLAGHWRMAEFGVFGAGNSSVLKLGDGTALTVRTSVINGTKNAPDCVKQGFTAEENDLNLGPCCSYGGEVPAIVFMVSRDADATLECDRERSRRREGSERKR